MRDLILKALICATIATLVAVNQWQERRKPMIGI